MFLLTIFLAALAVSSAQLDQPLPPEFSAQPQPFNDYFIPFLSDDEDDDEPVPVEVSNTNKNVNVILNVDPKQIAIELWAMIASHLQSRQTMSEKVEAVNEIEKIVTPLMKPSRRGIGPSTFDVADNLERLTRTLLSNDNPTLDPMDKVILVKDIVSDMLQSLKTSSNIYQRQIMDYNRKLKYQLADQNWANMYPSSRRSMETQNSNPRYLLIKVRGKKSDKYF